ncbi:MAG: ImmA/IrrE family metallo-endopeptidase [Fimbriimonadales bacterium]|nr:ImmA/IrrE family metallo-endopeptidase [Fimbriimonadales bacterium]
MGLTDSGFEAAYDQAQRLLDRFCVSDPKDLLLEGIAFRLDVLVTDGPIRAADAWLLLGERCGLVRVRDSIRWNGQRRFCIAHELGHWTLHRGLQQKWVCTESDMSMNGSAKPLERQANWFAAELLMPDCLFQPEACASPPSIRRIVQLAERFCTSLSSTGLRLLQKTPADAALVSTKNGEVQWDSRPAHATLPRARQGFRVGPEAVVHSVSLEEPLTPDQAVGPVEVPRSAWYPDQEGSLLEESILLIQNPRVALSVLTPI